MKKFEFSKDELIEIEELLNISNTINNIYEQLYQLEIDNKIESHNYQKLIDYLKEKTTIENQKYAKLNYKQCKNIFSFLLTSNKLLKENNTECLLFQKYDDKIPRRIMSFLSKKIILDENYQQENIELINNIGINIPSDEITKILNKNVKIEDAVRTDVLSILLTILNEYISNKKYNKYKNELIKLKYYILLINKDIEEQLLITKFNISNYIYLNSNILTNILKVHQEQYDLIKNIETELSTLIHISELLELKDTDYNNDKKNIESIIRQCYIRALLTLMNEEAVYNLNKKFYDLLNDEEYLKQELKNSISENIIIYCFKCQKQDRPKIRTLSIKIPK